MGTISYLQCVLQIFEIGQKCFILIKINCSIQGTHTFLYHLFLEMVFRFIILIWRENKKNFFTFTKATKGITFFIYFLSSSFVFSSLRMTLLSAGKQFFSLNKNLLNYLNINKQKSKIFYWIKIFKSVQNNLLPLWKMFGYINVSLSDFDSFLSGGIFFGSFGALEIEFLLENFSTNIKFFSKNHFSFGENKIFITVSKFMGRVHQINRRINKAFIDRSSKRPRRFQDGFRLEININSYQINT